MQWNRDASLRSGFQKKLDPPGDYRLYYIASGSEHHQIRHAARRQLPALIGDSQSPRWVQSYKANSLLQRPSGKVHHVSRSAIQREHAAGKPAIEIASSILDLYFKATEAVPSFRHAGRADGVGDQNGPIKTFGS